MDIISKCVEHEMRLEINCMAWHNELEDVWGRHNQRNEMVKIKQKANKNTTRKKKNNLQLNLLSTKM